MKAVVVFGDSTGHWMRRLLKPGFRHCFVVVQTEGGNWLLLDGKDGVPHFSIIGGPGFSPRAFYEDLGYTAVEVAQSRQAPPWPLAVANCVGFVKAVLAISSPLTQTPYALYRHMERRWRIAP